MPYPQHKTLENAPALETVREPKRWVDTAVDEREKEATVFKRLGFTLKSGDMLRFTDDADKTIRAVSREHAEREVTRRELPASGPYDMRPGFCRIERGSTFEFTSIRALTNSGSRFFISGYLIDPDGVDKTAVGLGKLVDCERFPDPSGAFIGIEALSDWPAELVPF